MLTPVVRQEPAPDEYRTSGSQPAHQSMSTDVQRVRLLPCTTSLLLCQPAPGDGNLRLRLLKTDIRAVRGRHIALSWSLCWKGCMDTMLPSIVTDAEAAHTTDPVLCNSHHQQNWPCTFY